jgi:transcriptional regulator with XRE-family HTH domain
VNEPLSLRDLIEMAAAKREASGLRLAEIAEAEGHKITVTTINAIRQGVYKSRPRASTIRAIAWLAGVTEDVAFQAAGQPAPGPPFADELPPGVDNLPPKARRAAIEMLRALVDLNRQAVEGVRPTSAGQEGDELPRDWHALAAYQGPGEHTEREREWGERGEEPQEPPQTG